MSIEITVDTDALVRLQEKLKALSPESFPLAYEFAAYRELAEAKRLISRIWEQSPKDTGSQP